MRENFKKCPDNIQKEWMVCMKKNPLLYLCNGGGSKRYKNLWKTYIYEKVPLLLVVWNY